MQNGRGRKRKRGGWRHRGGECIRKEGNKKLSKKGKRKKKRRMSQKNRKRDRDISSDDSFIGWS